MYTKIKFLNSWTVMTDVHIRQRDEKMVRHISWWSFVISLWTRREPGWTCRETTCTINQKDSTTATHISRLMFSTVIFFCFLQSTITRLSLLVAKASNGTTQKETWVYIPERPLENRSVLLGNLEGVDEKLVELIDRLLRLEPWGGNGRHS